MVLGFHHYARSLIKVVAEEDTELDIELAIPIGEFEELGY